MTDILGAGDLSSGLPRRDFLKAGGMLVVGFAVAPSAFAPLRISCFCCRCVMKIAREWFHWGSCAPVSARPSKAKYC